MAARETVQAEQTLDDPNTWDGCQPWDVLTDVVLQREALVCAMVEDIPPSPNAGAYISDVEALRIANALPGFRRPLSAELAMIDDKVTPTVAEARAELLDGLQRGEHPLAQLSERAGLSDDELVLLAVLIGLGLDRSRQRLLGYVQDDLALPHLQIGTLSRLPLGDPQLCAPDARLVATGLVEVHAGSSWASTTVQCASDVIWWVCGGKPSLPKGMSLSPVHTTVVADSSASGVEGGVQRDVEFLLVAGGHIADRIEVALQELNVDQVLLVAEPSDPGEWRRIARTALLQDVPVCVDADASAAPHDWSVPARMPFIQWIIASRAALPASLLPAAAFREVEVRETQLDEAMASRGHQISKSEARVLAAASINGGLEPDEALKRLTTGQLDDLATRVRARYSWDDLVLQPRPRAAVEEVADRYRNRRAVHSEWGFGGGYVPGLVALFAGPSGTGKTMAAQVVAADVGVDLYRVDLSGMVSKWIGESEKNLARVFDAADSGAVALLFDEADALFGKRTDVKDSHDRYANQSTSYLLQRIEEFTGLLVLSTNLSQNIDDAFKRRIDVQVNFTLPDVAHRRLIWERAIPHGLHRGVDLDELAARHELSGASIHNAAVGGAHFAAVDGVNPQVDHYHRAVARELEKLGQFAGFGTHGASDVKTRPVDATVGVNGHA